MIFFFLSEGKAVGKFLIAILVLVNFLKSLFAIHNLFRPLGKPVSIFLIAIPVLVFFLKSLFAIHIFFRALGKAVSKFLIAIPVLLNLLKSLFTIHGVLRPSRTTIHSNPIHFICFSNPLHLQSTPLCTKAAMAKLVYQDKEFNRPKIRNLTEIGVIINRNKKVAVFDIKDVF